MGIDQHSDQRALPALDGASLRVGVVCGRFNDHITIRLLDGVRRGLGECGVAEEDTLIEWVPGAFEAPFAAQTMISAGACDAVIALGCVIRGDTSHYEFVAGECARGLQQVGLSTGVPVIFGVLTTENLQQALDRSEGAGGHNVGEEGARTYGVNYRGVLGRCTNTNGPWNRLPQCRDCSSDRVPLTLQRATELAEHPGHTFIPSRPTGDPADSADADRGPAFGDTDDSELPRTG